MDDIQVGDQFIFAARVFTVQGLAPSGGFRIQETSLNTGRTFDHLVGRQFLTDACRRIDTNVLPYSHRS